MSVLGFILIISGLLVVTYFSGPKSSSEQSKTLLPPQGQVTALPVNSPSPSNKEEMVTIRNKTTGEVKQVLKSAVANYVSTPQPQPKVIKASDKPLRLAAFIFATSNENQRNEFINKFSNGTNDSSVAVKNLALLLDSKPEAMALAEKTVAQYVANKKSQEESNAIVEYNRKEYERLKAEYDKNVSNTYIGGTQDTYIKPNLPKETKPEYIQRSNTYIGGIQNTNVNPILPKKPNPLYPNPTENPEINILGGADSYTRYGNTVLGSDGSSYTQYGDTVLGSDGSGYTRYGNTILGNDGSSSTKYGDTTLGSEGRSFTQYGNTILGSDGSSYTNYGNTMLTQPGY